MSNSGFGKDRSRGPQLYQSILVDRYEILGGIGTGSFGTVALARKKSTGCYGRLVGYLSLKLLPKDRRRWVAVKSMKTPINPPEDCLNLRELQSLHIIPSHPSIVPIIEAFYDPSTELFHIVMEYMEQNLYQLMSSRKNVALDLDDVRTILQILAGIEHCHKHNYFHRDIKPENVLVTCTKKQNDRSVHPRNSALQRSSGESRITPPATPTQYIVKLADFGLAREIDSRPPYTAYVSTRWYRAPEVLLRAVQYSSPVDMWAFGAMAYEVATLTPLFPGSDEYDQVGRICEVIGSPADWRDRHNRPVGGGMWKDGNILANKLGFSFEEIVPQTIEKRLGQKWPEAFSRMLSELLRWNPEQRCTAISAMYHDFFAPEAGTSATATTIGLPRVERLSLVPRTDTIAMQSSKSIKGNFAEVSRTHSIRQYLPLSPTSRCIVASGQDSDMNSKAAQTNRQSWFARKKDSIIARSTLSFSDASEKKGRPTTAETDIIFRAIESNSMGSSSTPAPSSSQVTSRLSTKPTAYIASKRQLVKEDPAIKSSESVIPEEAQPAVLSHKMSRTISDTSTEQYGNKPGINHPQASRSPAETGINIGYLFSHLRKKHKKSEHNDSARRLEDAIHESSLHQKPFLPSASGEDLLRGSRSKSGSRIHNYAETRKECSRCLGDPLITYRELHDLEPQKSAAISRTTSLSSLPRQQKSFDRASSSFCTAREFDDNGPISSRTRRASRHKNFDIRMDPQSETETGLETYSQPHGDTASRKQNAGIAQTQSVATSSRMTPSYAKSTAASQRRSSNIHVVASQSGAANRRSSGRQPLLQAEIPMNSFQRSLF